MFYISGRSKEKVVFEGKLFLFPDILKYFSQVQAQFIYLAGKNFWFTQQSTLFKFLTQPELANRF